MNRLWLAACLVLALVLPGFGRVGSAQAAAAPVTYHLQIPWTQIITGCTEDLLVDGDMDEVSSITFDASGGVHGTFLFHPDTNMTVTGLSTRNTYQATGVTRFDTQLSGMHVTTTYVNGFKLIGPGPDNNTLIQYTSHVTVNPDGTTIVESDHATSACR
jgi:hypothetical protein